MPNALRDAVLDPDVTRAIDSLSGASNRTNQLGFDAWGFHPESAKVYFSLARHVYDYFRPVVTGVENIPSGRCLIVPNHSGQLPYDALVIAVACLLSASPPRVVRSMAERWVPTLPWINEAFSRAGVVLGDPINCRNLLQSDQAILVFPEGARGSGKVWKDRYKLQRFGRGFVRLALQTNAPIVPCSVVGAEESIVSIYNWKAAAKLFGIPYVPIHPLLPFLGPLAYLPLPTKFHVRFGEPLHFDGPWDDEDSAIDKHVNVVQSAVQSMVDDTLASRKSVF